MKEFRSQAGFLEQDMREAAEATAWDIYQNANLEARMMYQLDHPHVLGLVGLAFRPIRLLLELAPLGDLKSCAKKFQRARTRLSRRTLKATMIQVCQERILQRESEREEAEFSNSTLMCVCVCVCQYTCVNIRVCVCVCVCQ